METVPFGMIRAEFKSAQKPEKANEKDKTTVRQFKMNLCFFNHDMILLLLFWGLILVRHRFTAETQRAQREIVLCLPLRGPAL
jgi:hypothetical protein